MLATALSTGCEWFTCSDIIVCLRARFVCLVFQPEDGEILKVLTGEQPANALHKEVEAAVRLEMAGVQGTVRAKKFTSQLVRPGSAHSSNAILMVDAGT